jgi:hypothetical protein
MRRVGKELGEFEQLRYGEATLLCRLQNSLGVSVLMDGDWAMTYYPGISR